MTTLKIIFNHVSLLNPESLVISSLGSKISNMDRHLAQDVYNELVEVLPTTSLAYKVLTGSENYTEKQLLVITYEAAKNEEYVAKITAVANEIERRENAKIAASKAKLAVNKSNSQSVLDYVKSEGKLLKDYYSFVKSNKKYAREFFSKKFSMNSANDFLNK